MKLLKSLSLLLVMTFLYGCASVPMATPEADLAAKQFTPAKGKANIYVYRNEKFGAAVKVPVSVNGLAKGSTAAKTFFHWEVEPGQYKILSHAEKDDVVTVDAVAGSNNYVWQEIKMGAWSARTKLQKVDAKKGKKGVEECKLIAPPVI